MLVVVKYKLVLRTGVQQSLFVTSAAAACSADRSADASIDRNDASSGQTKRRRIGGIAAVANASSPTAATVLLLMLQLQLLVL